MPKQLKRRTKLRDTVDTGHKFPVVEVFGPTIQGEGIDQGTPCYFVRLGGCDYRCEWCDSPHAVLPHAVRAAERLTAQEIVDKIKKLPTGPEWVVMSGGNPALHKLGNLVTMLRLHKFRVALETQGTLWKNWIPWCDAIAVSPKPPSSKMATDIGQLTNFLRGLMATRETRQRLGHRTFLKIVVFDGLDYDFARVIHQAFPDFPMFLSSGNDAGKTVGNPDREDLRTPEQVAIELIAHGRWLANRVMVDESMRDVRVQMQQHVLYWGNEYGR